MKSIPDHVLKNAVVIVPRKRGLKGIVDLNFALMGMLGAVAAAGCVFLAMVAPYLSLKPISLPAWFYLALGCIPALVLVSLGFGLSLRKSGLDIILGYNTLKGEVIIAERRFGRPRKVIQIALAQVQAIRIYWLAVSSDNPDVGWWNAQLVQLDGKGIPLGNIKGKPATPPDRWLARFKRVSTLLDKPLEILPSYADTQQTAYTPVVDQLIKNIRQQSGPPSKPPEILAHSTNAEQITYSPPAVPQDRPTVLGSIRSLYKKDETFRWIVRFMVWGCCFSVSFGLASVMTRNYWLHLLGWFATSFFFALPFIVIPFIKSDQSKSQRDHKLAYFALTIFIDLLCLILSVASIVSLVRSSYDLYHGPIYGRGVIERTGSGKYTTYVIVRSTHYDVPDHRWFQTMELGQGIEFLYGPMTHFAYPPP